MKIHKMKIEPKGEGQYYVQVDGREMNARSLTLHMDRESVPDMEIELVGEPDIEVEGLVQYDFTPRTVKSATNLLKAALIKNDITAFLAMHSLNKVMSEIKKEK